MPLTKYPSTWHLPWSENYKDTTDRVLDNADHFEGKHVIITEKMDGENTTMYGVTGKCHARSLDSAYHESRSDVRRVAGEVAYQIPPGYRVCGENMFAKHSIHYKNLDALFLVFSVWSDDNRCLSWRDTQKFCDTLSLKTVPVLYQGMWTRSIHDEIELDERAQEGYVIRLSGEFDFEDFGVSLAKYVRKNHVQTSEHWLRQQLVRNIVR